MIVTEIKVRVSKTLQEDAYEPRTVDLTLTAYLEDGEAYDETLNNAYEEATNFVNSRLGLKTKAKPEAPAVATAPEKTEKKAKPKKDKPKKDKPKKPKDKKPADTDTKYDASDIKAAISKAGKDGRPMSEIRKIMADKYNAYRIADIKPEDYPAFLGDIS